jgi:shikimate dehydrogenase
MQRLAVIGHPVAHSRSPAMQTAALAALGLGEEWRYEAIDVAPERFEERLRAMADEGFAGANVTVPHKQAALALADTPSEMAREVGAANTLVFADGEIQAHNTDAEGFLAALPESPRERRALVLGAGGAARAVVWALLREGAEVEIWNRTPERAQRLCAELGGTAVGSGDETAAPGSGQAAIGDGGTGAPPADILDQAAYDLIVNTTTVGLKGEDPFAALPLEPDGFGLEQTVVDMVYGDVSSPLLAAAAAAGVGVIDGIEILVQQGALSLAIWTGRKPPLDAMRDAARA